MIMTLAIACLLGRPSGKHIYEVHPSGKHIYDRIFVTKLIRSHFGSKVYDTLGLQWQATTFSMTASIKEELGIPEQNEQADMLLATELFPDHPMLSGSDKEVSASATSRFSESTVSFRPYVY